MTASDVVTERLQPRPTGFRLPALLRRDRAAIAGLTALALIIRVPTLGRAYWIDEAISIGISSHHLTRIPGLLREDGSPPLFYFLLHFWLRAFGNSEIATHTLPLLVSLIAIPVAYWAARELFDRRAGLAAAALVSTNPFLNWYSTETRMYTLVVVLGMVAVTFAWKARRDRRLRHAAAAVVSFAALLYTHDWGIYLTGAVGLAMLWLAWSRRDRKLAVWVVGCGAATLALWAPWLPSFIYQARHTAAPWAVGPAVGDFFADPSTALAGTVGFLVVPLLVVGVGACRDLMTSDQRAVAGWLAATAFVATAAGWIGAQIEPSWTVRYLAIIVGPYLLAAAIALGSSSRGRAVIWSACALLAIWAVVGNLLPNPNGRFAKDNMAAVAAAASPQMQAGDVVVVTQTEQVPVAYHYLPPGLRYMNPMGPVSDPGVVDWRNIVQRLQKATPCQALSPTLDAVPVGTDVLEINPVRRLGATGSAWSRAVNSQVAQVDAFLANDPGLKQINVFTPGLDPKPFAPVDGILYQKTSRTPSCA